MSVVINARGTSIPFFTIGKSGITLYQGVTDPSLTYTVKDGDMWLNNSTRGLSSWNSTTTTWVSVANGIFKFPLADGTNGQVLATNASGQLGFVNRVSTLSVTSANGFAGTVSNPTTTPSITLTTSVTGIIKGNGVTLSAATAGTDYSIGTSSLATGILKTTTTTGALSVAIAADFPILNQNTTGTATNVTGIVAVANGGTGASTAPNALTNLGGTITGIAVFTAASAAAAATTIGLGNVNNTSDVNKPVSLAQQSALNLKADLAGPTFTGSVNAPTPTAGNSSTLVATTAFVSDAVTTGVGTVTKASIGLGNVDNTSDANKPVSTAQQTALDLKANIASPTFTGTVSGITAAMVGLGNVNNTSDANKPVSTAQQTALDLKANIASPTFTGTVSGITKSMVGLGNVDNTSDANKPVSTAQQTALDLKANLNGAVFTGTISFSGATVTGLTKTTVGLGNVDNTSDANKPVSTAQQTALNLKVNLAGDTLTGALNYATETSIASAVTTDLSTINSNNVLVTGTSSISGLGTLPAGSIRQLRFTGILTMVHNATSMILIGSGNITTVANDVAIFMSLGSGNWRMIDYVRNASVAGGATGAGGDQIFYENGMNVTSNYTLTSNKNAGSFGPITINNGITVTVPSGAVWSIV